MIRESPYVAGLMRELMMSMWMFLFQFFSACEMLSNFTELEEFVIFFSSVGICISLSFSLFYDALELKVWVWLAWLAVFEEVEEGPGYQLFQVKRKVNLLSCRRIRGWLLFKFRNQSSELLLLLLFLLSQKEGELNAEKREKEVEIEESLHFMMKSGRLKIAWISIFTSLSLHVNARKEGRISSNVTTGKAC